MLIDQLKADLNQALKNHDETSVRTLRFLLSEIKYQNLESRGEQAENTDEQTVSLIRREVKKHQESIAAYQKAGRADLVKTETEELQILASYLPAQMPKEEVEKIIHEIVQECGASGQRDFGKVMGKVMERLKGKADGGVMSGIVKEILNKAES